MLYDKVQGRLAQNASDDISTFSRRYALAHLLGYDNHFSVPSGIELVIPHKNPYSYRAYHQIEEQPSSLQAES